MKMSLIDAFKNQHIIIQILDVLFVISFIYEVITLNSVNISLWILGLLIIVEFCKWFFKKEE